MYFDGGAPQDEEVGRVGGVASEHACLRDVDGLVRANGQVDAKRERLEAALDALLEPHVVLEAVRDGSGVIEDFAYVEANAAACEFHGMSHRDLVAARLLDVVSEHRGIALLDQYRPVVETSKPLVLDDRPYANELLGGEERFYDVRAVRVGDGLSLTWRDVTKRHLAVEALAAAEARYRLLAENATDVVFLIGLDWTLTWVSPATEQVLGYEPAALVGTNTAGLIHPDDLPVLTGLRDTEVDDQVGTPYRLRVRRSAGDYRWMSGVSRAALDSDGNPVGRISTLRDVHEQVLAQQSLERSEAHFRLLAENASDVVAKLDLNHRIVWVSPSAEAVLGWRPDHLLGRSVVDLTHPDDRDSGDTWRLGIRAGVTPAVLELRVLTGDGSYRWMSVTAHPVTAADGSLIGRVDGMRDVHEQVLAKQALADSERRYRMLAENASDVVWHLDADTALRWVTPSIESVLGWAPEELLGKAAIDLVHPEDLPALARWRETVLAGVAVAPREVRVRMADGGFRWMSLHTRPTVRSDGVVDGAVVGLRDVHEQVIARQNLTRSEAMFRLAMAGAPQGMAVVGLHGRFLRVNDALCELVGRDVAWMHEHDEYDVIHPDDLANDLAARDRLLAGDAELDIHEGRLVGASGDLAWVQHSLALVRDEHNMPLFYVSQFQDITGARAAQQDLQYRAEHDVLTGLINREQLQDHLVEVLARQPRAAGVPAVLYCDLDYFKNVNDTNGHAGGDQVLRAVAERVAAVLRDGDQ
ncbi:MAG: PAS domain S-box protein, partial [Actinomycetes bacterium]